MEKSVKCFSRVVLYVAVKMLIVGIVSNQMAGFTLGEIISVFDERRSFFKIGLRYTCRDLLNNDAFKVFRMTYMLHHLFELPLEFDAKYWLLKSTSKFIYFRINNMEIDNYIDASTVDTILTFE